jgi:hypothetical protein
MITVEQLRELAAIQAEDCALWDPRTVTEAYITQGLRYLHNAIEGTWTFEHTKAVLEDLRP